MQERMVGQNSQFELKTLKVSEDTKKAIRNVVFSGTKMGNARHLKTFQSKRATSYGVVCKCMLATPLHLSPLVYY